MSHVTTKLRATQITCVTGVSELAAEEVSWVFFFDDFAGILPVLLVSFVGMFTSLGKSQNVASIFAAPTIQKQRVFKGGVSSDMDGGANKIITIPRYISFNRDLGHSGFYIFRRARG